MAAQVADNDGFVIVLAYKFYLPSQLQNPSRMITKQMQTAVNAICYGGF